MSRAEKFIKDYTRICSNEIVTSADTGNKFTNFPRGRECHPWLTPDQARKAVEIAREEIYEWLRVNLCNYFDDTRETFDKCIDDLKNSLKK